MLNRTCSWRLQVVIWVSVLILPNVAFTESDLGNPPVSVSHWFWAWYQWSLPEIMEDRDFHVHAESPASPAEGERVCPLLTRPLTMQCVQQTSSGSSRAVCRLTSPRDQAYTPLSQDPDLLCWWKDHSPRNFYWFVKVNQSTKPPGRVKTFPEIRWHT